MELTYVVNSNFRFFEKSTSKLFESLDKTGYNWHDKFVVIVGESPFEDVKIINGVKHCFVQYGGIDFTAAIYISENQTEFKDHVFYMHDTVYVGPDFFNLVNKDLTDVLYKRIRLRWGMNMGVFKTMLFKRYSIILKSLKFNDLSKETRLYYKALGAKYEDIICNLVDYDPDYSEIFCRDNIYQYNYDETYHQVNVDFYGEGVPRNIVYIPEIDFYKVKANIGFKLTNEWELKL